MGWSGGVCKSERGRAEVIIDIRDKLCYFISSETRKIFHEITKQVPGELAPLRVLLYISGMYRPQDCYRLLLSVNPFADVIGGNNIIISAILLQKNTIFI